MAQTAVAQFEQRFFRGLNAVVEPAVRRGIGSPVLLPGGLIVLESIGFKSGQLRRTPLMSYRLGPYRIVSTVRGDRSFWVRNLLKDEQVHFYLGGKRRAARAIVLQDGETARPFATDSALLRAVVRLLSKLATRGLAIIVLEPVKT